ncbi:MAG: hypothetical protein INR69_04340 [Mucilaginibacter polytrichastri]|nr:hypothetical protein [Mucilaginibacter polytrichastri]
MSNPIHNTGSARFGKVFAGLLLIGIGAVLILRNNGVYFPGWLFDWPVILILIGLFTGLKSRFRKPGSFILLFIGLFFLADRHTQGLHLHQYLWPVLIIFAGIWMMFGRRRSVDCSKFENGIHERRHRRRERWGFAENPESTTEAEPEKKTEPFTSRVFSGEDFIDSVSVFGGVKKKIISKQFRGGDIVNFFGGADIDLTQADIQGRVVLDVTQVFGGTKIIVPANWQVISEMAAIFGGIEDKRRESGIQISDEKMLIIKGTSIFAGIDIRSY